MCVKQLWHPDAISLYTINTFLKGKDLQQSQ